MKQFFIHFFVFLIICQSCNYLPGSGREPMPVPVGEKNLAYQWGKISLECTANDTENFKPRPTITSRILALTWTAVFDAWSRYDEHAIPFYLTSAERRPAS